MLSISKQLDTPRISLKTVKSAKDWLFKKCRENDRILSIAPIGGDILSPFKSVHSWTFLEPNKYDLTGFPSNFYDFTILNHTLSQYDKPDRINLITECHRTLRRGGNLLVINTACNDSYEIYDLLNSLDFDVTTFKNARLTSKEISKLKPTDAVFVKDSVTVPNRRRLAEIIRGLGYDIKLEQLWTASPKFNISRLFVAMKWEKK
jgi:hypothetical protein